MSDDFPGIHLVGSLPFENGPEAYGFIHEHLRPWIRRVPDETGDRAAWVSTQMGFFFTNSDFELVDPPASSPVPMPIARLKPEVDRATLTFPPFGYADAARASYPEFVTAREQGLLREDARFMVAMPGPHNPVGMFSHPDTQHDVLGPYEARVREGLDEILATIPHDDLAIQWDLVNELGELIDAPAMWIFTRADALAEIERLGSWVPDDVDLGFHLCFGDSNRDNIRPGVPSPFTIEPTGTRDAVQLRTALEAIAQVSRSVQFVHMAIPIDWSSAEHYAPLAGLELDSTTDLYLGVVHAQDDVAAAAHRAALARDALDRGFGIGTECGMGRYGTREKFLAAVANLEGLATELDGARR